MALWVKRVLAVLVLVGVALGMAVWFATARWNDNTARLVDKLTGRDLKVEAKRVD